MFFAFLSRAFKIIFGASTLNTFTITKSRELRNTKSNVKLREKILNKDVEFLIVFSITFPGKRHAQRRVWRKLYGNKPASAREFVHYTTWVSLLQIEAKTVLYK